MSNDETTPFLNRAVGLFTGDDFEPGLPTVLRAGYQVGQRYSLRTPLGRGGYGSVWVAHDDTNDELVAVKVLQALRQDEGYQEAAERLRREARAYQRLTHPAVARLRHLGETDQGEPYLVMDLLKGRDLAKTFRHGRNAPPQVAVSMLLPIADALADAHAQGLVHRDVKLSNIFLEELEGGKTAAKLIDFGLTKELNSIGAETLTAVGTRLGNPSYMSPEQARGKEVDARSDVWSYCVVLYRVVTGKLPFEGKNNIDLRMAILDEAPKPFDAFDVAAPELWRIVARGLEKKPEDRWPSIRDLAAALKSWSTEQATAQSAEPHASQDS